MIDKTLRLISQYIPGTYVSDPRAVFDEGEVRELASKLSPLLYSPAPVRAALQEHGVNVVPANFYSEVPSILEIEDPEPYEQESFSYGLDAAAQSALLDDLEQFSREFNPPKAHEGTGYCWDNDQFSYTDAVTYYCMIRHHRPNRVVEIGSGWSSQVALMALRANGHGELICVEPYPSKMLSDLDGVTLIIKRAQELTVENLNDLLSDGDIFFIDSTHTVKHNSDCIHIYLRLLPDINKRVLVHVHDIRLPKTLSLEMMRDSQIYWTEQYLLYAYLLDNPRCSVLFSSYFANLKFPERAERFMMGRYPAGGGSFWFSQQARTASNGSRS